MHFSWALKFDQDMHIADESKTVERHEQNAAALSWRLPHAATVRLWMCEYSVRAQEGDTAWVLYKNSLYKNLRGSNPRRATYFQAYQTHSTLTIWGALE